MHLNVSQLMKQHSGSSRCVEVDEPLSCPGADAHTEVRGSVMLTRTDRGVWVAARLRSEMGCACSRCLVDYRQPVDMRLDEEFLAPAQREAFTGSRPGPEDASRVGPGDILDLTEAVRQHLSLGLPMKPLCRQDCRGLCPTCGANLNDAACRCLGSRGSPAWDTLVALHPNGAAPSPSSSR